MAFAVSDEAKKRTKRCMHNFRCSHDDSWTCCLIRNTLREFLEIKKCGCDVRRCSYIMPYGASNYCCCPVRHEIFNKFGI